VQRRRRGPEPRPPRLSVEEWSAWLKVSSPGQSDAGGVAHGETQYGRIVNHRLDRGKEGNPNAVAYSASRRA